jgi:hypothetical protein
MPVITTEPEMTTSRGTAVASYRDLRGAALAVRYLMSRGWSGDNVLVRPDGLRPKPAALDLVPDEARRVPAIIVGALAGVAVVAIIGLSIASVTLGIVTAFSAGAAVYAIDDLRLRRRRARVRAAASAVEVERFDVVCSIDAAAANHELARWWDPDARPASARAA